MLPSRSMEIKLLWDCGTSMKHYLPWPSFCLWKQKLIRTGQRQHANILISANQYFASKLHYMYNLSSNISQNVWVQWVGHWVIQRDCTYKVTITPAVYSDFLLQKTGLVWKSSSILTGSGINLISVWFLFSPDGDRCIGSDIMQLFNKMLAQDTLSLNE